MLADTKLTPRLSPMMVCALLGIAALIPCLPTRAEPLKGTNVEQGVVQAADSSGESDRFQSGRFTFRMSVHTKDKSQGHGKEVDGPPGEGQKVTFDGLTLTTPAITVEGAQIASVGMIIPSIGEKLEVVDEFGTRLSLNAKPTATADGKIILDLSLKLEPEKRFAERFVPPESPFVIEDNQPRKIVLFGPQDDPVQWVEITVTKVKPQELYQLHGTFHLESHSAGEVQDSSQDFNIITTMGGSSTILLDQLKLAEVDPEISIPSFTLTLNPGVEADQPATFSGELSVVSRTNFQHRVLSRKRKEPYLLTPGKSGKYVLEEREGKPTFWFEMVAERVPGKLPVSSGALPPALAPHPQLYVQGFDLPERFWIKPGEPESAMRSPTREEFQPIIDHITRNISPNSWVENGGFAQYELLLIEHRLYVFSTREVHKQIEQYLKSIWRSSAGRTEKQAVATSVSSAAPGEPGYTPPSLGLSTIVAHNLVTPTGKDPLGRPIATREDYEKIIAILKEIEPKSWESNGGKGKIEYSLLMGTIYYQNSGEVSDQISERLELLLLSKNSSAHPLPELPVNAVIEPVSNEKIATNPSAPPVPSPAPALPGSVHRSLVGVVRSEKPADPNASYQLHLTSFVKTPETAEWPSEILSETPAESVLLQNHESKNIPHPFQRTYLNGTYIEKVPQAQVTASIVRFDDYLNLLRVRLIVQRDGADASVRGWRDSTVEIPLNHKLELVLERDDQKRPVHWLVFGVSEPNAPAPSVYAMNPPSIDHLLISSYSTVGSLSTSQMYVQSHRLPERFWFKPGEPLSAMRSPKRVEFKPIIDHITANFAPDSWTHRAGFGQYELLLLDRSLVVFSTLEVHGQIEEYLKSIQHAPAGQKEKHTLTLSFGLSGPGLFRSTPPQLGHTAVAVSPIVSRSGKDPLGRPVATGEDYEKFIATLKEIEPKSWESNGGKGKIEYSLLLGRIYFQNTSEVSARIHKHCSELLSKNPSAHPLPTLPATGVIKPVSNEVPDSNSNKPAPPSLPATPTSDNPQSKIDSQNPLYVVLYNVDKLFELDKDRDLKQETLSPADLQPLADQLEKSIAPDSWTSKGGRGVIKPEISDLSGPCLVIRQTDEIHEQINIRIDKLRRERGIDTSRGFSHYPTNPASPDPNKMVTVGFALPNVVLDSTIDADGRPVVDQAQLDKLLADLRQIDPQAWKPLGGPCSMTVSADRCTLSVTATPEVFGKVNRHLRKLYHSLSPPDFQPYNGPVEPLSEADFLRAYGAHPEKAAVARKIPKN